MSHRRRTVLACVVLAALTLAAFGPIWGDGFVSYDDRDYVTDNPHVLGGLSWRSVAWAFQSGYAGNWHPVTWLSHLLDVEVFGLRSWGHHLTSLLLHTANTVLLFLLLMRATGSVRGTSNLEPRTSNLEQPAPPLAPRPSPLALRCALVAGLFALHPLRVESVAWVAERKDVLSGFFLLLTLWAYVRYAEVQGVKSGAGEQSCDSFPLTPALSLGEREDRRQRVAETEAAGTSTAPNAAPPAHEPRSEGDGPLSRSLSPSEGERVPKAGEGAVHGFKARTRSGKSLPKGEGWGEGEQIARACPGVALAAGSRRPHASLWYALSLVLFALGLMSKPMLVTLPFVLLLLDYWPLGRLSFPSLRHSTTPPLRLLLEKVPFFALAAASCVVTFLVQRGAGAVSSLEAVPLEFRLTNALISYVRYVGKTVWPANLAVFYPPPAEWPVLWVAGAALLLAGVTVMVMVAGRRRPYFAFGWLWYLGMLVPVIGIVQVGQQAMADRYTYIPLIGLFVLLVWAGADVAARWPRFRLYLAVGAAAALVACGVLTWQQTSYWCSSRTLFAHALAITRGNFVAHNNLGVVFMDEGNLAAAEQHFNEAVRIKPAYPEALGNLALCRSKEGQTAEAMGLFERSLQIRPTAAVEYDLARLLFEQGKLDEAAAHSEAALRLRPELVEAWYNLGLVEVRRGRQAEAERNYEAALQLKPNHAESHLALGALLGGQNRGDEAIAHFQAAVRADPANADGHFNLAFALNGRGDFAGAAAHYAEACRLHPQDVEARSSLALALLAAGRVNEAVEQMRAALRLRPDARIHYYLALALDTTGRPEEAVQQYREAVRLSPETPLYLNDLAWFLATNPKAELRNGTEAVKLAERARDLSGGKQARFWGTLDAAYAEAGRFTDALAAAANALELARAAGQPEIAREAEARMALYRAGKPYRRQIPPSYNPPQAIR